MSDWKKTCLGPNAPLVEAIQVLSQGAMRIVLVVDQKNRLLGTVTDGDIRRALIRHCAMDTPVAQFMSRNPTVASVKDDRNHILLLMQRRDILQIPLVDSENVVVGLETFQGLNKRPFYENPVFLMAGGFGKRLRPLTLDTPKPLLKVGKKPILENILEQFIECGFHNFFISTHYKAKMLKDYFGDGEKWNVSIRYVYEEEPCGTAGALGLLPEDLPQLPVIVMNGDLLTKVNFEHLLEFHNESEGIATMCVREYDFQVPYGVVKARDNKMIGIEEKPIHKFFVNAGIYVLDLEIVRSVEGGKYLDMPDLLETCVDRGDTVTMFPIHEFWLDIGNMPDYKRANSEDFIVQNGY
ncbi:mannose-1-phosphate guanylyltransferase [Desulfomarina profundi]|uniref:Mannose-1-phosphate guanylyltransferase n=2 Tax=Desulfomarina profundi TaxID=2772557 RepID=A0A8D5FVI4_9BACT|nr:nucleotidyltransferase family protein [Desulfomarina profundi]BCL60662.1 mannose-1-phosphate guanylyltransferase [Desulfomarina profundi]